MGKYSQGTIIMKLTESQLRQIIREEISNIRERSPHKANQSKQHEALVDELLSGDKISKEIGYAIDEIASEIDQMIDDGTDFNTKYGREYAKVLNKAKQLSNRNPLLKKAADALSKLIKYAEEVSSDLNDFANDNRPRINDKLFRY